MRRTLVRPEPLVKKAFLNNEENVGIAAVVLDVSDFSFGLQISDCNRNINLHNDVGNAENRANALYKLRTLRDVCQAGIDYIEKLPAPTAGMRRHRKGGRRRVNVPSFFTPYGMEGVSMANQARAVRMIADMIEGKFEEARAVLVAVRQEAGLSENLEAVEFLDSFDRELTRREKQAKKQAQKAAKKLEAAQAVKAA